MIPRGEVGLIFANLGLAHHILDGGGYAAVVAVVLGSTLLTPPLLRVMLKGSPLPDGRGEREDDVPASGSGDGVARLTSVH
jgi:hypothetical protein